MLSRYERFLLFLALFFLKTDFFLPFFRMSFFISLFFYSILLLLGLPISAWGLCKERP